MDARLLLKTAELVRVAASEPPVVIRLFVFGRLAIGERDWIPSLNAEASHFTHLGGRGNDNGLGIAVDSASNAYVMGVTGNFAITPV